MGRAPTGQQSVHRTLCYLAFGKAALSSPTWSIKKWETPAVFPIFWYSGANQIRTIFLFSESGFYVTQRDGLGAILVVEGDDQLVIVEINTIDESIDQPLAVRLLAQPHCGQGAGAGQSVPDHKHPHLGGDAGRPSGRPGRRRQTQECHSGYAVTKNSPPGNSRRQIFLQNRVSR